MEKFILLLLFLNFHITVYNQIIKGTVMDQNTKTPITYASVYFNTTFVQTYTDQNGYFTLDISKYMSMPLTVSALGYYSTTINDFQTDKPLLIYLSPKVFELKEVVVIAKNNAKARRRNLKFFKTVFLGITSNASKCQITNEKDIIIINNTDNDTIKAFSSKPILIDNQALGYKISYYLDRFEFNKKDSSFLFDGNIIFNEDLMTEKAKKNNFERRREIAYLGSRMHFFRALWENNLDATGFTIRDSTNEKLNVDDLVIQNDNPLTKVKDKYLSYPGKLRIFYNRNLPTDISFLKDNVYFEKCGYFDGTSIKWEGEMAAFRIADWLPFEYSVK
jgi:hypothetical protein